MAIKSLGLNNLGKSFGLLSEISNPSFKFNCFALDKLTEGAKMHIAAGIDTFKIYIAPDKLAAKSIQEKLSSWGLQGRCKGHERDMVGARDSGPDVKN